MQADNPIEFKGSSPNKHMGHRKEVIHSDSTRAFLTDPSWPRTDHAPNLTLFEDRKVSQITKVSKMHKSLLYAQNRALDTAEKVAIVDLYKN